MTRVHVLVEGQTEETFIRDLLAHYLYGLEIYLNPILLTTKRVKAGPNFKGGITSYTKARRDLRRLLGDTNVGAVTTMIDFYGLPEDFPGVTTLPCPATPLQRVRHVEDALRNDIPDHRLIPYLSLHEFEALLLVDPEEIGRTLTVRGLANRFAGLPDPEDVDDGEQTHPAARILAVAPSYRKAVHGPLIAKRIGLEALRLRCPHFASWVHALEALAG